jgi:hypothetical protein
VGDQQATQLEATLDVARARLSDMERKRDELTAAVDDLREQMKMVEEMLFSVDTVKTRPSDGRKGGGLTCRAIPPPPRTCSTCCTTS